MLKYAFVKIDHCSNKTSKLIIISLVTHSFTLTFKIIYLDFPDKSEKQIRYIFG